MLALFSLLAALSAAPEKAPPPRGDIEVLTLEEAIQVSSLNAVEIVRAKDDLLLADVDRMRALSVVLPSLNVSSAANELFYSNYVIEARTYRPTPGIGPVPGDPVQQDFGPFADIAGTYSHPGFNLTVSARQLIYDGGRWWVVLARSKDVRASRAANLEAIASNLRLNVVRRFYEVAKAARGVETFNLQVRLAEDQLLRAQEGVRLGKTKQHDIAAAARNLASDRVTLARRLFLESQRARALNLALGREPGTLFQIAIPREVETTTSALRAISIPTTEILLDEAAVSRPEVKTSLANLEIIRKNIDLRLSEYLPTIGLNASYLRNSRRPDRVFGDPTQNSLAIVGLDLRWNVFQGFGTDAGVEEAEIEVRKAIAQHQELVRVIRGEVLEKIEQLQLLTRVFELNRDAASAAEEATAVVSGLYRENRATLLELRDAEFRLITARDAIYDVRFDLEIAIEELQRAIGRDPRTLVEHPQQTIE